MKKKLKILTGTAFMLAALSTAAFAADDITVAIDCKPVDFDQKPIIENGRTLVPLRAIFEAMGAEVEWNGEKEEITAEKNGDIIKLTVNSTQAFVNNELRELDVPAKIINERTLVPVRFIAESMKCEVDWNEDTQTVIITDKPALVAEKRIIYTVLTEIHTVNIWNQRDGKEKIQYIFIPQ